MIFHHLLWYKTPEASKRTAVTTYHHILKHIAFHNITPHSPNTTALTNLCIHTQHTAIPINRKFSAHHSKLFQMHPWTYTGSQSCCSGRRPSYKHKPRREQRESSILQLSEPQLILFTLNRRWKFTGVFEFPSAIYQVIFQSHRHLPFILFLKRWCTLPSQDR